MFKDRIDAAKQLSNVIKFAKDVKPIILAIPRGGVIIGDIIASQINADLDIIVSKKIGAPENEELAIGAVMHDGSYFPNEGITKTLKVSEDYVQEHKKILMSEIARRLIRYRGKVDYNLKNRVVVIVDDGVATGATLSVAASWVKKQNPKEIIIAVPGGSKDTILELSKISDQIIALETPDDFRAVGQLYEDFGQVSDDEVIEIMKKYRGSV